MECALCGRYRPSSEIDALSAVVGSLVMACARCRGIAEVDLPPPVEEEMEWGVPVGPVFAIGQAALQETPDESLETIIQTPKLEPATRELVSA